MASEDPAYLSWLRRQPCAANAHGDCNGGVEAHHATHGRAFGKRAHDSTAVPLCSAHHRCFHDGRAPFVAMGKEGRRDWMDKVAARMRLLYTNGTDVAF